MYLKFKIRIETNVKKIFVFLVGDLKRQNKQKSKAPPPPPPEEETEIASSEPRFSPEKDIALATLDNVIQEAEESIGNVIFYFRIPLLESDHIGTLSMVI